MALRSRVVLVVLLLLSTTVEQAVCADASFEDVPAPLCPTDQSVDQLVVACTRNFPCVIGQTLDCREFVTYACDTDHSGSSGPVDLFANAGFAETWIFIHGNQISPPMAIERGIKVYRTLRSRSEDRGPIRFVIWSWPSERTTNPLSDARRKAKRTDVESFLFGSFLAASAQAGPTSILAYSFGARIACGGLHLAGGGTLCGYRLPEHAAPSTPYRVAFLAAAVENDGLLPRGRYNRALAHTDKLLLQNNSNDRVLRFFWVMNKTKPAALGFTGLCCAPPSCMVNQYDWGGMIGRDHSLWQYTKRQILVQRVVETLSR